MTGPPSPPPRRVLFPDARGTGGLRVSRHADPDLVVFSLWRDDVCIGTARLPPHGSGELAAFLAAHAERSAEGPPDELARS